MSVKAIYEDGVFKPKERVELKDKTDHDTADGRAGTAIKTLDL